MSGKKFGEPPARSRTTSRFPCVCMRTEFYTLSIVHLTLYFNDKANLSGKSMVCDSLFKNHFNYCYGKSNLIE